MRAFFLGLALLGLAYLVYVAGSQVYEDGNFIKWSPLLMGALAIGFFCYRRLRVELAE